MDGVECVARWLRWLEAQGKADRTIGIYRSRVTHFLAGFVEGHPCEASYQQVSDYLSSVGKQGPAGRVQTLRALRSAFRFWKRHGIVELDPSEDFTIKRRPRPRQTALREGELVRILVAAWAKEPRRAWALMLTLGIGARRQEVAGITPRDVVGESVHLRHCKGGKDRWVPLSPMAREALKELRPAYNGTVLGGVRKETLTAWAKKAAKDAGLYERVRGRPMHILRSSYASHLLRQGIPIHVVRDLLGHESLATTNEYSIALAEDLQEAAQGFNL